MSLTVTDLQKSYKEVQALGGLSFKLEPGSSIALLGPNGAGKSTAIKILTTLVRPDSGRIEWGGKDLLKDPPALRDLVGYVSQEIAMDKVLTAVEFMRFTAGLLHLKWRDHRERALALIDQLGLREAQDRRVGEYSGGMKRRLDLATALLHNPRVLILDEPTTGLDIEARELIWRLIEQFKRDGGAVILASHDFQEVQHLADHVLILEKGVVKQSDAPDQLKQALGRWIVRLSTHEFMDKAAVDAARAVFAEQPGYRVLEQETACLALACSSEADMGDIHRQVFAAATDAGLPVFSLNIQHPNLEDVYRFSLRGDA
ncbi:ABC transporter ATP-binding protein [Acanthopleuribacter pedis]|uniref:ABC transporter ATP-binding protein n=1 Tax=Acanthopleuribacter pedis TaxID=442870 RepID=A0A8J7QR32_9BACT|nr:ABC transporter ATP-binding protein [Acanthopleuribacter pedis]MBO1322853.1 ABC transporter ATP-binding protein [Acanthopleuribacter pedis]